MLEAHLFLIFYIMPLWALLYNVREDRGYIHLVDIIISLVPVFNILGLLVVVCTSDRYKLNMRFFHKK